MSEDGLQDAAILLMSLGEAEAAEVFKFLSPKEVQKLGEAIANEDEFGFVAAFTLVVEVFEPTAGVLQAVF